MFISFDNGQSWQSFQRNLPATVISDFKVYRDDLVIATQGRGFWIVDNLTPLHGMTAQTASSAVHLFAPRTAYRMRGNEAVIDYWLGRDAAGPITLDIIDSSGRVIRTYSSAQQAQAGGAQQARPAGTSSEEDMMPGSGAAGARFGATASARLVTTSGMHRFAWDMRTGGEGRAAGVAVAPGRYTVRLTAPGSAPVTTTLVVEVDPRLAADGINAADLQAQYELSLKVAQLTADAQQLQADLRAARQRLEQAENAAALTRLASIERRAANEPGQAYPQQMLIPQISYLSGIVTRADNRPHRDAFERHDELRRELDALRAELQSLLR
jgi:hypothetical protein